MATKFDFESAADELEKFLATRTEVAKSAVLVDGVYGPWTDSRAQDHIDQFNRWYRRLRALRTLKRMLGLKTRNLKRRDPEKIILS